MSRFQPLGRVGGGQQSTLAYSRIGRCRRKHRFNLAAHAVVADNIFSVIGHSRELAGCRVFARPSSPKIKTCRPAILTASFIMACRGVRAGSPLGPTAARRQCGHRCHPLRSNRPRRQSTHVPTGPRCQTHQGSGQAHGAIPRSSVGHVLHPGWKVAAKRPRRNPDGANRSAPKSNNQRVRSLGVGPSFFLSLPAMKGLQGCA